MSNREKDDDYDHIVAQLGPKNRVIVCKDNWQWIVQERKGEWRSVKFCTSRDGVLRWTKGLPGTEALASLPDRFPYSKGRDGHAHSPKSDPPATPIAKTAARGPAQEEP